MAKSTTFTPFISSKQSVTEFSWRAIILGMLLGLFFAVGNTYLALRVGMTVSASIPSAVLSMGILGLVFKRVTILEHNIVQTIASIGESLAAGVGFTIPAIFLMGGSISVLHIFLLSFFGGLLGILFMIPMRRYLIVKEHGILPYPEGTACAEILLAKYAKAKNIKKLHQERASAIVPLVGILMGALYKAGSNIFFFWKEQLVFTFSHFQNTQLRLSASPALIGVGYIVGPRIALSIFSGGLLGWGILIPLISLLGTTKATIFPGKVPIADMNAMEIWSNYVRYVGAGTVAWGGLYNLWKILPTIGKTFHEGFKEIMNGFRPHEEIDRTDRDISLAFLLTGSVGIVILLWLIPGMGMNLLTILIMAIFGFLFAGVTSITVGVVGSSSNPISGIIITVLLLSSLLFSALGWDSKAHYIMIVTMSAVVSVAIAMAGATSQDLKTGYIVGSTPRKQQIAEIFGLLLPSLFIGGILALLNQAYTIGSPALPAPQATLVYLIGQGMITHQLPYTLIMVGVLIGVILMLLDVSILSFGIGLYLPFELSSSMLLGGIARYIVNRWAPDEKCANRGILLSSGLVAGDATLGVIIALLVVLNVIPSSGTEAIGTVGSLIALILFLALFIGLCFYHFAPGRKGR